MNINVTFPTPAPKEVALRDQSYGWFRRNDYGKINSIFYVSNGMYTQFVMSGEGEIFHYNMNDVVANYLVIPIDKPASIDFKF